MDLPFNTIYTFYHSILTQFFSFSRIKAMIKEIPLGISTFSNATLVTILILDKTLLLVDISPQVNNLQGHSEFYVTYQTKLLVFLHK